MSAGRSAIGLANLGDLLTRISQWEAAGRALAEASGARRVISATLS